MASWALITAAVWVPLLLLVHLLSVLLEVRWGHLPLYCGELEGLGPGEENMSPVMLARHVH